MAFLEGQLRIRSKTGRSSESYDQHKGEVGHERRHDYAKGCFASRAESIHGPVIRTCELHMYKITQ